MAISSLPSGDDGEEGGGIVAEINVTPLTDIFLVLLIIFMVTTTIVQNEGKNIDLPSAEQSEETPSGVTVAVTLEGAIQVNNRIVSPQDLPTALEEALGIAEQKVVILRGDKRVLLGQAVDILDMAQKAGAESIALATQSPSG
ncbi:MAG: biopolymer transporter ExbD [Proteobacteria bacterium]|nr:biopolymer transporter ExbD [Pseudomonadota bacterium]